MFEQSRAWKDKNSIPNNTNGIYRYLNHEDTVIYIGMGNIKERTSEADRKDWGIKTIQFSEVLDFSENKKVTKNTSLFTLVPIRKCTRETFLYIIV